MPPTVLQIVPSLDESYGGPAVSVPSLAAALEPHGFSSHFLSVKSQVNASVNTLVDRGFWHEAPATLPFTKGFYSTHTRPLFDRLIEQHKPALLHVHSVWAHPTWSALDASQRHSLPLVISPRSEFYAKSLQKSKALKLIARPLFVNRLIAAARGFHATDPTEEASIREMGARAPILVSANGVDFDIGRDLPSAAAAKELLGLDADRQHLLFMSRFHFRKRPDLVIEAALRSGLLDRGWSLLVAGNIEDEGLAARLKDLIDRQGLSHRVHWFGHVSGASKQAVYAASDIFVLPSEFENFGNAIVEAMICGIPVITSHFTPWTNLSSAGAGWTIGLTVAELTDVLLQAESAGKVGRHQMGQSARSLAAKYSWPDAGKKMADFYSELLDVSCQG